MGLFDFFKKGDGKKETLKNVNSFGEPLDKLTQDGELPFGWVVYKKDFISSCESMINNQWEKVYSSSSTEDKLKEYRKYFDVINNVGEICKNEGECHYRWFEYYVITSQSYEKQVRDYQELKRNAQELIKRENLLKTLETDILEKLKQNEGILQSEFVKLFDELIRNEVKSLLYQMDKNGTINREKHGRSYILTIKRDDEQHD